MSHEPNAHILMCFAGVIPCTPEPTKAELEKKALVAQMAVLEKAREDEQKRLETLAKAREAKRKPRTKKAVESLVEAVEEKFEDE